MLTQRLAGAGGAQSAGGVGEAQDEVAATGFVARHPRAAGGRSTKKRWRVGLSMSPMRVGLSQACTASCEGMPPLWTTWPAMTTA